ncbi:MAG: OadG family transporter subunit [Bacteroidales bacterium]|nr:OadG family transporter subunit [Bacteroidales bacterium]MDD3988889.1 OadG family transporter subunit [Bacteroidales bacterium]MDD4639274.1 OadG family transporter subunit [Bacteroidales bacterium]
MKRVLKLLLLVSLLFPGLRAAAQSQEDMRLNEILVVNTNDFEDDFGHKNGWIELFNSSYGTVNIGGCYLTNDPSNLTKYIVPKGDVLTFVKPRQHILFWADNQPYRGTFHVNFTLEESEEILLVASDGRTIIDRVRIPHTSLGENISFGRKNDGIGDRTGNEGWEILARTSPSTNNSGVDDVPKGVVIKEADPYGAVMAITAMSVVFVSLILLYIIFKQIGKYNIKSSQKRSDLVSALKGKKRVVSVEDTSAEVYAAIATALHLYQTENEAHDIENTILTITKVTRNYSPWSSKIYTLRETPSKKR